MRHVPCAPRARDRKPSDQALLDAVGERAHQVQKLRGSATRVGGRRWDELYGEAAAGAEPSSILLTEAGAKTAPLISPSPPPPPARRILCVECRHRDPPSSELRQRLVVLCAPPSACSVASRLLVVHTPLPFHLESMHPKLRASPLSFSLWSRLSLHSRPLLRHPARGYSRVPLGPKFVGSRPLAPKVPKCCPATF